MTIFKKTRLSIILSSFLLLASCGGGGGGGGEESSVNPEQPSGVPGFEIPGKTPVPGEGGNDPGGENPGGENPGSENPGSENPGGNPEGPKPIETAPWVPIKPTIPKLPADDSDLRCLVFSDIHARYPERYDEGHERHDPWEVERMVVHPSSWTSDDNDLDFKRFHDFLGQITADWEQKKEKTDCIIALGDTAAHGGNRYKNIYSSLKDLKEKLGDKVGATVISVFGNNDSAKSGHYGPHDLNNYSAVPNAAGWKYIQGTRPDGQTHSAYLSKGVWCSETATYPCVYSESPEGYASIYLRDKVKLIAMESVMFATENDIPENYDGITALNKAKDRQFNWLKQQVWGSELAGDKVIFAMHLSPTVWLKSDEGRFKNIIAEHNKNANAIGLFAGHSHHDDAHGYKVGEQSIPRFSVIGLSTSHANRPGYREVTIQKVKDKGSVEGTWAIKDSVTKVFTLQVPGDPADIKVFKPKPEKPKDPVPSPPAAAPVEIVKLYSFNETYCPTWNPDKSSGKEVTVSRCLHSSYEKNRPSLELFETGLNPNCYTHKGGCKTEEQVKNPPPKDPPVENPVTEEPVIK